VSHLVLGWRRRIQIDDRGSARILTAAGTCVSTGRYLFARRPRSNSGGPQCHDHPCAVATPLAAIMGPSWIVSLVLIAATSASAQVTNEEFARCWTRGTAIPAESRVQNCTQLIERGERGGLPPELLAAVYSNRGLANHELHRSERAINDYERAINLKPDMAEAYYNRANVYGEKRLYDEAIADYSVAIRLAPDVPTYANRGWTYEKMGRRELAIADYRMVLKLDPSDQYAQSALKRLGVAP